MCFPPVCRLWFKIQNIGQFNAEQDDHGGIVEPDEQDGQGSSSAKDWGSGTVANVQTDGMFSQFKKNRGIQAAQKKDFSGQGHRGHDGKHHVEDEYRYDQWRKDIDQSYNDIGIAVELGHKFR